MTNELPSEGAEISTQKKSLTANNAIISMLQALNNGKSELVYSIAENYLEGLAYTGHAAYNIRGLLKRKPVLMQQLKELPHQLKNLLRAELVTGSEIFLTQELEEQMGAMLLEWGNLAAFEAYNLPVRNKILLHGASGNGKTSFAKALAHKSGLPYFEVKGAQIVASHLGESGKNVESLFEHISGRAVVFYDEIDSIGLNRRSGRNEHEEISRAQNVMLVHLEKLSQDIVFIAATNRYTELDAAFVRRFDAIFELPAPDLQAKIKYLSFLGDLHNLTTDERTFFYAIPEKCESYSDIKRGFIQQLRGKVIDSLKK